MVTVLIWVMYDLTAEMLRLQLGSEDDFPKI